MYQKWIGQINANPEKLVSIGQEIDVMILISILKEGESRLVLLPSKLKS